MNAVENMKLLTQLQQAINKLPSLTAGVILEDEWGNKFDLLSSFATGACTDAPGLVMQIRMRGQHPDADRGVIR